MSERLPTFPREAWSELLKQLFGPSEEPGNHQGTDASRHRTRPPNILLTIGRLPELLAPFLGFASALATKGALPRRESELLALRASWNCRSAFEWGHHAEYALDAGVSEDEIERVALGPEAGRWTGIDLALLRAADELHDRQRIGDETWTALSASFDAPQLVEITFVVGNYTMLSMVANSTDVPLEEGLPPMPDRD